MWGFPKLPKYHPMFFNKFEAHKRSSSVPFQFVSVHAMNGNEYFKYITGYLLKKTCYHHLWNKIMCNFSHIFTHKLNSMIANIISKNTFFNVIYFSMVILSGKYFLPWNNFIQSINFLWFNKYIRDCSNL